MKLSELPNIGKELEKKLESFGIRIPDELLEIGSIGALRKRRNKRDSGCLNMLYALEGAIQGIRWHDLPADVKTGLRDKLFVNDIQ